ncbi:MAG: hypothetical protein NT007_15715 [Candidatus Kapabacteria bacterium]|nr:hypothetical protein [Candidatus Kapabacteria bacterium]
MKATIILSICALILFAHCQTNPTQSIKTQDSIEIVTDTMSVPDFRCLEWGGDGDSVFMGTFYIHSYKRNYLIKSVQEYDSIIKLKCNTQNSNPPTPDFTQHFLVGFQLRLIDSTHQVEKTILRDNIRHKYIYQINTSSIDVIPYNNPFNSMCWLLIPAFPDSTWTFEIDTTFSQIRR